MSNPTDHVLLPLGLITGVFCVVAAIVGGQLETKWVKFPKVEGKSRIGLGVFGAMLIIFAAGALAWPRLTGLASLKATAQAQPDPRAQAANQNQAQPTNASAAKPALLAPPAQTPTRPVEASSSKARSSPSLGSRIAAAPNGIAIAGDNNGEATVNNNYGPANRTISEQQKVELRKGFCALLPFPQSLFTIEALANVEDAEPLMWQLSKLLEQCKHPVAHPGVVFLAGEQPSGISVRYSGKNPETFIFANALNLALNDAKLESSLDEDAVAPTDSVTLTIGAH